MSNSKLTVTCARCGEVLLNGGTIPPKKGKSSIPAMVTVKCWCGHKTKVAIAVAPSKQAMKKHKEILAMARKPVMRKDVPTPAEKVEVAKK